MIRFVTAHGHGSRLGPVRKEPRAPAIDVIDFDRLIASRRLPRVPHVFTDFDRLAAWDLELAAIVHHRLRDHGVRVLNDPARAKTRYALLRALHEAGVNDFNAYQLDEGVRPARFPVFLRRAGGHGSPLSDLLPDWDAARQAVDAALEAGVPASAMVLIEYAAEPVRPGFFRKLAMSRVGDRLVPGLIVHQDHWIVKYGQQGSATPALYADELRIARENSFAEPLGKAFEIAGIEYGRADFGLVQGRPQVYEINTNPDTKHGGAHPSPIREQTQREIWADFVAALHALDEPPKGHVAIEHKSLARERRRWLPGRRRRRVP